MKVDLHPDLRDEPRAEATADAIAACVHCGFCLATCPTYLDRRDERDSPRGRIYLVKQFLETNEHEALTLRHLDRCLTCRSCETTCPSGVMYGNVLDGGRTLLEPRVRRPLSVRLTRWGLRKLLSRRRLLRLGLGVGRNLQTLVPRRLREALPRRQTLIPLMPSPGKAPSSRARVLLLEGCVQSAATPNTNRALRNVLARLQIEVVETPRQGCCGALPAHLGHRDEAQLMARRNIDAWWPHVQNGVDAILSGATGCGVQLHEYEQLLAEDDDYAVKARAVTALVTDAAKFLGREDHLCHLAELVPTGKERRRVALHTPCTQVHGLSHADGAAPILDALGYILVPVRNNHLCCGSAGTYSLLEENRSRRLRTQKLKDLTVEPADVIATANVGCQLHLEDDSAPAVVHWLELAHDALAKNAPETAP